LTAKTGTGGKKTNDERASDQPQTQTTSASPDFSEPTPSSAGQSAGSSSTTTGTNVQSVAVQSTPNYSNLYSVSPLHCELIQIHCVNIDCLYLFQ